MKKRAIRRQLNTILAKLETMQIDLEEALACLPVDATPLDVHPREPDGNWHWDPDRQQFITGPEL